MIPAFFILAWGLGVAGIVTAIVAERKAKTLGGVRKTMARWGGVLSICAFILGCVGAAIVDNAVNELGKAGSEMQSYSDCLDQAVETGDPLEDCAMAVTTEQGKVNIVERLPSEHDTRTSGDRRAIDYDIAVSVVKYLARPTLRPRLHRVGRVPLLGALGFA